MADVKSCADCIFNIGPRKQLSEIRQSIDTTLCARGKGPTSLVEATTTQKATIQQLKAKSCNEYSTSGSVTRVNVGTPLVVFPTENPPKGATKASVTSCSGCAHFIPPDEVYEAGLWNAGVCSKFGKMIPNESLVAAAASCEESAIGPRVENAIAGMQLFPEYSGAVSIGTVPEDGFAKSDVHEIIEPTTYETDAPVSSDDEALGIRAWRRIADRETGNEVHLPIYDIDFFDDDEQAGIPRTGDDEHPEQYVDHMGLVYKAAVLWLKLEETPALWGVAGTGKASPVNTPVLTPTGWRRIGDLSIGDLVIGKNGQATKVTGVFPQGVIHTNRVTMTDGSSVLVGDDHLWQVNTGKIDTVLSTKEMQARGLESSSGYKFRIPMVEPVDFDDEDLSIDPYMLGVMLANGSLTANEAVFTTNNEDVVSECEARGYEIEEKSSTPSRRWKVWAPRKPDGRRSRSEGLWYELKQAGLAGKKSRDKFIPVEYLRGAADDRRDLLAALLDCDGSVKENGTRVSYHTMSDRLATDVVELVRSLGGTATQTTSKRDGLHTIAISVPFNPFRADKKWYRWQAADHRGPVRKIKSIEDAGMSDQVCIMVEAEDHLYVTEDYIVTHNTEFFRHMAWLMCLPFHRISITASTEVEDLAGKMHFEPSRGTYFEYGRIPRAWMKPGVICLDEPNVGPPDVWQFIRPLTDNSKQLVLDMNNGERVAKHASAFLGLAMNPAWDIRNVGTGMLADADGSRLMHIFVDLPDEATERRILIDRCKIGGYDIPSKYIEMVMKIAKDLRVLCSNDTLPITWGIRPQIKVSRALQWFNAADAYRLATADYLEPEQQQIILDVVKSHTPSRSSR